jgi:hypothetical protein
MLTHHRHDKEVVGVIRKGPTGFRAVLADEFDGGHDAEAVELGKAFLGSFTRNFLEEHERDSVPPFGDGVIGVAFKCLKQRRVPRAQGRIGTWRLVVPVVTDVPRVGLEMVLPGRAFRADSMGTTRDQNCRDTTLAVCADRTDRVDAGLQLRTSSTDSASRRVEVLESAVVGGIEGFTAFDAEDFADSKLIQINLVHET